MQAQDMIRWIPAVTAAKVLRVSRQRIYELLAERKLIGQKVDGHQLILTDSVNERLRMLRKGGR